MPPFKINLLGGFSGSAIWLAARNAVDGDTATEAMAEKMAERVRASLIQPGQGQKWPSLPNRSSAPGDPPARQYGQLLEDIEVWKEGNSWRVGITTDAESAVYGVVLEYGNSHIAPRPFLRPVMQESESAMLRAAASAVTELLATRQALGLIRGNDR